MLIFADLYMLASNGSLGNGTSSKLVVWHTGKDALPWSKEMKGK